MRRPIKFTVTVELVGHEKSPTRSIHKCQFKQTDKAAAEHYCGTVMKAVNAAFDSLREAKP